MHSFELVHLSDDALLRALGTLVSRDRAITAGLLAHIAEADARRLYAPAGYPSMHAYCVGALRLSEDSASKRIQAARAARRFPVLFEALAEGRLHLTAVRLLAPHLNDSNVSELVELATHRRASEIEEYLACRFGTYDPVASLRPVRVTEGETQHAAGHVECHTCVTGAHPEGALELAGDSASSKPTAVPDESVEARFLLQVTLSKGTHEKIRHAQALLSHAVPNGDIAQVLDRALDRLILDLEKRKAGVGRSRRLGATARERHIPAEVRRAVWERDHRQCTFVSANGVRCGARTFLEFDHVQPVSRGGVATVDGIRLRCRAHNQYEAERILGAGFMQRKREEARRRAAKTAGDEAATVERSASGEQRQDLLAGLRTLGVKRLAAIRAAEVTEGLRDAGLEDRMRAALAFLGKRVAGHVRASGST